MESDEETEIFSYTPLKREKIGENVSTFGSLSRKRKSKVNLTQSSQCHQQSLNKHCMKSKVTSIEKQKNNSINERSSQLSRSNIKKFKGNNKPSSVKPIAKSSEGPSSINPKEKISKNDHSKLRNSFKLHSSDDESKLSANDSSGFGEIPDIDFSLLSKSSHGVNKIHTSIKSQTSDDEKSESLLEDRPSDLLVLERYDNSDAKNDVQSSSLISNQKGENCHEINAKNSLHYSTTNFSENVEKVDSWLQKSFEFLTPQNVEIIDDSDECGENHQSSKGNEREALPSTNVAQDGGAKACIHLHFHVNSPKKFIQPTIEKFFNNSSGKLGGTQRNEAKSSSNPQDVVKTWEKLMNVMRGDASQSQSPSKSIPRVEKKNLWNKASCSENAVSAGNSSWSRNGKKTCPFYKYVEGTSFVVDAFSYGVINGVSAYFLSHFHYDHYRGLSKNFTKTIYCSKITANLVRLKLRVPEEHLNVLPLEEPIIIHGVEVTLYEANHCPGAVMFHFKLPTGKTVLHVGDFRAHPSMETIRALRDKPLDVLYLDTTYLDPRYDFPSQEKVIEKCTAIARHHAETSDRVLFLVGSYLIGKERVFKAVASELNSKIFAPTPKSNVLLQLEDEEISERLTKHKLEAQVHVVSMSDLTPFKLKKYMDTMVPTFDVLVAIKPTGWTHSNLSGDRLEDLRPQQMGNVYLYGLPYSEHSSYCELKRFVQFVEARKIIPTVNTGNPSTRIKMESIFAKWQMNRRISKS